VILLAELVPSVRRQSQTFDEACHTFAGYRYWTKSDFGFNPEHPPLVKLLSAIPLLGLDLKVPPIAEDNFKLMEYIAAQSFLYSNDADMVLNRARLAASILTVFLCLSVFCCARQMFGPAPAWLATLLFVFEPNILAHGALVTTDMGITCFLFSAVYAFYRYIKKPNAWRLLLTGIMVGLTLGAKHSGIVVVPILLLLAVSQPTLDGDRRNSGGKWASGLLRRVAVLVAIGAVAVGILWSLYGFRFQARPQGAQIVPALADYLDQANRPVESAVILGMQKWRVLPEAYLYGLADVLISSEQHYSYVLGRLYPRGQWFYFPLDFVAKSTIPLLIFLLVGPFAFTKHFLGKRLELSFIVLPPVLYFAVSMTSGFNLGVRHILPIFPFLMVLAAVSAWRLAERGRPWMYAVAALLIVHVASSLLAFPNYLAYSNEIAGGSRNTYKILADSNVDWGQSLKLTKQYLDRHQIKDCWFAYFGYAIVDPSYYKISCKPLPTALATTIQIPTDLVPTKIQGTVLVSVNELSGIIWGPGKLNPYWPFQGLRPVDSIGGSVLVFQGQFDIPVASAQTHSIAAWQLAQGEHLEEALAEARQAVALAPDSVEIRFELASLLKRMKKTEEARQSFQEALTLAKTVYPEYRKSWVVEVQQAMAAP
jgi:4-amino-4-deoxy-L-arabinose transferase-like glycosyltransferase